MVVVSQCGLKSWVRRTTPASTKTDDAGRILEKNPYWLRLRETMLRALLPFPDAWTAVSKAIASMEPAAAPS